MRTIPISRTGTIVVKIIPIALYQPSVSIITKDSDTELSTNLTDTGPEMDLREKYTATHAGRWNAEPFQSCNSRWSPSDSYSPATRVGPTCAEVRIGVKSWITLAAYTV